MNLDPYADSIHSDGTLPGEHWETTPDGSPVIVQDVREGAA